ncbi:MAG: phosphoglycerate dehydrogenase [Alphaproteobacteria bacterium]|jgi:phosphoglycerate dehydrogenase-like enzyme|nr:phosphoglycerate dehydrogenase [Alphaproteobacteria bacterium]MBT7941978.1 phosphoglycerate dehydrogenase [Alphaproteobacteria bacterium]
MLIKATSGSFSKHPKLRAALLAGFPDAVFNDDALKYTKAELIDYIADTDGLVLGLEPVDDEVLAACPNLKIVAKFGVGLDNLDVEACENRGIAVGWTGGTNKRSVAEMDLCFMLAMARNLYPASMDLKGGTWNKNGGFQLSEKTVGVIGLGYTGSEIVRLLKPFNCRVLGNDIVDKSDFCAEMGVHNVSKEEIFSTADFITIHTPLTDLTHHLINRETLSQMKATAFVINTARGPIVDGGALKQALLDGVIAGAALDVYEDEPPTDMEFLTLPNLFCTPHIGGNADEAVMAMGMSAINHLKEFFDR